MTKIKLSEVQAKALDIIKSFPKSKNGLNYLTLKNGNKVFFTVFITKYGLDGSLTKYNYWDIIRRIRIVEFFDCFTKNNDLVVLNSNRFIVESAFHRMIVIKKGKPGCQRYEVLSFYSRN